MGGNAWLMTEVRRELLVWLEWMKWMKYSYSYIQEKAQNEKANTRKKHNMSNLEGKTNKRKHIGFNSYSYAIGIGGYSGHRLTETGQLKTGNTSSTIW